MRKADSLWRALERTATVSVRSEWEKVLGADMSVAEPFLRPTGELATALVCPHGAEAHRVWHGDDGKIIEFCDDYQCDEREIAHNVLIVYRFCFATLASQLAAIMGLSGAPAPVEGIWRAYRIGELAPRAGTQFPAFLAWAAPQDMGVIVERFLARTSGPFVLVVPRADRCPPAAADLLRQRGAELVSLDDHFVIGDGDKLVLGDPTADMIARFRERVAPKDPARPAGFDTPPGAKWEELKIQFENEHEVLISVRGLQEKCDFRRLGLVDARRDCPSQQWIFLRDLGPGRGVLARPEKKKRRSPDVPPDRSADKQRDRLAEALQCFFGIDGDPIETEPTFWRARFKISSSA